MHSNECLCLYTVTKKAVGSSILTIESLEEELNDGIVFIFGGITDAFGAAQDEMTRVMRHIDERANEICGLNKSILLRKSVNIPDLIYDYGGSFREACTRTCQMHNFDQVLVSLFNVIVFDDREFFQYTPLHH